MLPTNSFINPTYSIGILSVPLLQYTPRSNLKANKVSKSERTRKVKCAICLGCEFIVLAFLEVLYRAQLKTLTVSNPSLCRNHNAVHHTINTVFSELGKFKFTFKAGARFGLLRFFVKPENVKKM